MTFLYEDHAYVGMLKIAIYLLTFAMLAYVFACFARFCMRERLQRIRKARSVYDLLV